MTFSSLTFLTFLAVVFSVYWIIRRRKAQNVLLLIASYVFYGWWDWRFCGLILASSLIDYALGWATYKAERESLRRCWLALSVTANLSLLGFFKYYNFFADSFAEAVASLGWHPGNLTLDIILPVGISFYTFQTLSYTIDIYRRQLTPSTELVDYLAFVSFFPQLVAGPIERASNLLPQFAIERKFDAEMAADGLRQILWGLFKKLAVADRLALIVDPAYSQPEAYSGAHLAFATVCFAFQIYCDFSGYSDIAIGVAKQFGITLSRNFAYPYFSQSFGEFWRRWHISLSTWFRDYVYIPLGGNQGSSLRVKRNLLITFLVSGIWHGAAWTYIVWGTLHGVLIAAMPGRAKSSPHARPGGDGLLPAPAALLKMALTFSVVCSIWVFFRAATWADSIEIERRIFTQFANLDALRQLWNYVLYVPGIATTVQILLVLVVVEWFGRRKDFPLSISEWPRPIRWGVYTTLMWATVLFIPEGVGQEFIYFDF